MKNHCEVCDKKKTTTTIIANDKEKSELDICEECQKRRTVIDVYGWEWNLKTKTLKKIK